ncbi:glucose-1-phosphate thymidylyltransferase [Micromonospora sp. KC723]|uniref:glucose-1-phosphate thymidylyltransferase n=1 Tax=Micromonospora sp. KC723 TaxID=2530381 RepID=UPI0010540682|nr:glucose-1-phosphate thymidylyltransferase [Micromonospora sp. KC723]TDB78115.1 glucose-1-phosphate thymidylyltransferase [Micromonospora sp. KC723]
MKALVLAGGKGTRLRPFTYSLAKQLVPVAGKPVLVHCLEKIREIGVREVGIVVGERADEIMAVVNEATHLDLTATYIRQDQPRGLAHCVAIARDFLGDDDFVMYLGDNVFTSGIHRSAAAFARRRPDALVTVTKRPDPQGYGVVDVNTDGVVRALLEKPAHPPSDLVVTGAYFFTPVIHEAVRAIQPSGRGELEITDALQHLVDTGHRVVAEEYTDFWRDTGSIDELLECNRELLERLDADQAGNIAGHVDADSVLRGTVVVGAGTLVERSRLTGPLVIGEGARVTDSDLGPGTSVGRGCVVRNSGIEDSILLEGADVDGLPALRRSLVGRWAQVNGTSAAPHRLIIGDHALAEVAA